MSRPQDHQKKEIAFKTNADTLFPVNIASAPEGKYTWNRAIQYDMEMDKRRYLVRNPYTNPTCFDNGTINSNTVPSN